MIFHYNISSYFQSIFFFNNELNFDICYRSHRNVNFALLRNCIYLRFTFKLTYSVDCNVQKVIFPISLIFQVEMRSVGQQPPTAPSTFELIPVRTEPENPLPIVAPPSSPGNIKLNLDQVDRQILHSIEDHAIQVQKVLTKT